MKSKTTFRRRNFRRIATALCAAILASSAAIGSDEPGAVIEKDGLVADLKVVDSEALVRWRFVRPLRSPLKEITGDIEGRSLGTPKVQGYPGASDRTAILTMLDISGKQRLADITEEKATAMAMVVQRPAHVLSATAVYAAQMRLIGSQTPDDLFETLAGIVPEAGEPNLAEYLAAGIADVAAVPSQRKAIFVLTDGYSSPPLKNDLAAGSVRDGGDCSGCVGKIAELAAKSGVSIYFFTTTSDRPVDLEPLDALAQRTGGRLVKPADLEAFLSNPYVMIDSGGTAVFPIPKLVRYFWQSDQVLRIKFSSGDEKLELGAPVPFPKATIYQTAGYLWRNYGLASLGALLFAAILGAVGGFLLRRRRKRTDDLKRWPALAVLQDTDNGAVYSVQVSPARIGRSPENEVVLGDKTVSRLHAILERVGDGSFQFQNKSEASSTLVNGQAIETCKLSDGDVISLGGTSLRFARVPSW